MWILKRLAKLGEVGIKGPVWDFIGPRAGGKEIGWSWTFWMRTTFSKGEVISKRAQKGVGWEKELDLGFLPVFSALSGLYPFLSCVIKINEKK